MIGLAFDENFNRDVLRGLLRRNPRLDVIHIQEAGLARAEDPVILEWAAQQGRVLISNDVSTITPARMRAWRRARRCRASLRSRARSPSPSPSV